MPRNEIVKSVNKMTIRKKLNVQKSELLPRLCWEQHEQQKQIKMYDSFGPI